MSHDASVSTLKIASWILIAFGLLMMLSVFTSANVVLALFLDLAFLPVDGAQAITSEAGWLVIAVSGGLLTGWGSMIYLVTTRVYMSDPVVGGQIVLLPILAWFCVDSFGSVMSGAWFNVVLNLGFVALFALPVLLNGRRRGVEAGKA